MRIDAGPSVHFVRTALFRPFSASALWYADGTEEGVTGMVVYWDLAALVNGAADYLLLLSAARLAGRTVPRLPSARPTPCSGLFCRARRG